MKKLKNVKIESDADDRMYTLYISWIIGENEKNICLKQGIYKQFYGIQGYMNVSNDIIHVVHTDFYERIFHTKIMKTFCEKNSIHDAI